MLLAGLAAYIPPHKYVSDQQSQREQTGRSVPNHSALISHSSFAQMICFQTEPPDEFDTEIALLPFWVTFCGQKNSSNSFCESRKLNTLWFQRWFIILLSAPRLV